MKMYPNPLLKKQSSSVNVMYKFLHDSNLHAHVDVDRLDLGIPNLKRLTSGGLNDNEVTNVRFQTIFPQFLPSTRLFEPTKRHANINDIGTVNLGGG